MFLQSTKSDMEERLWLASMDQSLHVYSITRQFGFSRQFINIFGSVSVTSFSSLFTFKFIPVMTSLLNFIFGALCPPPISIYYNTWNIHSALTFFEMGPVVQPHKKTWIANTSLSRQRLKAGMNTKKNEPNHAGIFSVYKVGLKICTVREWFVFLLIWSTK